MTAKRTGLLTAVCVMAILMVAWAQAQGGRGGARRDAGDRGTGSGSRRTGWGAFRHGTRGDIGNICVVGSGCGAADGALAIWFFAPAVVVKTGSHS